jgi:Ca2+-binding RTX toxin-like protein
MTIMSGSQDGSLDFGTLDVSGLFEHTSAVLGPEEAVYSLDAGSYTRLTGTGLAYNNADEPVAGTATGLKFAVDGLVSLLLSEMDVAAASLFDLAAAGDTDGFLALVLAGDDMIVGTSANDSFFGLSGADILRGRAGKDRLEGSGGNDTLDGGMGADRLIGGSGLDIASYANAQAGLTASLSSISARTGEAKGDVFISIEGLTGSDFGDRLGGNAAGNTINGGSGADRIEGFSGKDTLRGGAGTDTITGGAASDHLAGGGGADTYVYLKVTDSGLSAEFRDVVTGFVAGTDKIDLSAIDANPDIDNSAFTFIGGDEFSAPAQLRAAQVGGDTLLQANTSGTSGANMTILLENVLASSLSAGDFVL